MNKNELSSSLEDYLECIYNHIESNGSVRAIDLSRDLHVSRASVTEALNRLTQKSYINYGRYEAISITKLGTEKAKEITDRHNTLKVFFRDILNIHEDEAIENACRVEHVLTVNAFEQLKKLVEEKK